MRPDIYVSVLMFSVVLVFIAVVSLVIGKQLNVGVCYGCCFVKFYALFGLWYSFVTDIGFLSLTCLNTVMEM
jgi:hypothetical protein